MVPFDHRVEARGFCYHRRMARRSPSTSDTAAGARLSWAAVLGLLTSCAGCGFASSSGDCDTDTLPKTDPCFQKSCCETITIGPDGGVINDAGEDAGPGVTTRMCGACNG
jgi:hypothetical protein